MALFCENVVEHNICIFLHFLAAAVSTRTHTHIFIGVQCPIRYVQKDALNKGNTCVAIAFMWNNINILRIEFAFVGIAIERFVKAE